LSLIDSYLRLIDSYLRLTDNCKPPKPTDGTTGCSTCAHSVVGKLVQKLVGKLVYRLLGTLVGKLVQTLVGKLVSTLVGSRLAFDGSFDLFRLCVKTHIVFRLGNPSFQCKGVGAHYQAINCKPLTPTHATTGRSTCAVYLLKPTLFRLFVKTHIFSACLLKPTTCAHRVYLLKTCTPSEK